MGHKAGKAARIVLAVATMVTALVVSAGAAHAFDQGTCGGNGVGRYGTIADTDYFKIDTGSDDVDLGDQHYSGAPHGNAVACWERRLGTVNIEFHGRLYFDPHEWGECGMSFMAVSFARSDKVYNDKTWYHAGNWDGSYHDSLIEAAWFGPTDGSEQPSHMRAQLYRQACSNGSPKVLVSTIYKKLGDG
jgi:hypothetical protein